MSTDKLIATDYAANFQFPLETSGAIIEGKLEASYDQDSETLNIRWKGEVRSEEIKRGYASIMQMVRHYKPRKWVLNLQERDGVKRDDQRWVFKYVFPRALRAVNDDIFLAVILPVHAYHSVLTDIDGDELIVEDKFLVLQHFLYPEEGKRWLESMVEMKEAGAEV
ncbi:hypothetical protein [Pontibacter ruber]|uniref:Uncharacterized protein n=1 Tax=Pontibacter ruber TaxID=1343895 RepID=A0ABW5CS18_9BACT|nr:hypothetical protein [Pontibacter ruber]